MATTRMSLDFSVGPAGERRAAGGEGEPLRMLVLADLGGSRDQPLAARRALAVDIDSFDGLFDRLGVTLAIDLDGLPQAMRIASLDDFHPDRLLMGLPVFDALRRLRSDLGDPARAERAAAALGLAKPAAGAEAARDAPAADPSDIGWLLNPQTPASPIDAWLREAIVPHIVPDRTNEQRALQASVDTALTEQMRRVLHHPRTQALEAAWRGIDRLVRRLELGPALQLYALDVARDEIGADLASHRDDLAASAVHRLLAADDAPEPRPWGLLAVDFAFGPGADDVSSLALLGALAARAGAPLLAAATPQAAGSADLAGLAEPRSWLAPDAPELAHWAALRASPMAAWIGLALPRVLLRLPYGPDTDPVDSFAFDEMPEPRDHATYLWGHGALALALLAARAHAAGGRGADLDAARDLDDLPSHVFSEDGESRQQPCAELLLTQAAGDALLARGLMPLLSWRDRDAVRLPRWQSLADPPCALQGLLRQR